MKNLFILLFIFFSLNVFAQKQNDIPLILKNDRFFKNIDIDKKKWSLWTNPNNSLDQLWTNKQNTFTLKGEKHRLDPIAFSPDLSKVTPMPFAIPNPDINYHLLIKDLSKGKNTYQFKSQLLPYLQGKINH